MLGNCACAEFCEYLDHNDPLCTECKMVRVENGVKVYTGNYEWACDKCNQKIKPGMDYTIEKLTIPVSGYKEVEFKRYHYPECVAGRTNGKSPAS